MKKDTLAVGIPDAMVSVLIPVFICLFDGVELLAAGA